MDGPEAAALRSIIEKAERRLRQLEEQRLATMAKADEWFKKYEAYKRAQVEAGHKVSSYTTWLKRAPGSYGQPKG